MPGINEKRRLGVKHALLCVGVALALPVASATAAGTGSTPRPATPSGPSIANPPGVAWCAGQRVGSLSEREKLQGSNLTRLRAAQSELAPGFTAGTATTGLRLLADYQDELSRSRPDGVLAASYLAQVSTVPITPARLLRVNALLCVSTTRALAGKIQTEAEAQRLQMSR